MRKLVSAIAVFLALSSVAAYPEDGPFYSIPNVLAGPTVQVWKLWLVKGTDRVVRKQNFLVPVSFQEAASGSKEGTVRFGPARMLLEDGGRVSTSVVPVRGTALVVLAQDDYKRRITVSVLDLSSGQRRELAGFPHEPKNPSDGAYAITRSGQHVLLVGPDKITIWDVVNWRVAGDVDAATGLPAVRAALMRGFGNPGNWWLSDDLHYIVVERTPCTWGMNGEEGPVYPAPLSAAGVTMDLANDAVVLDRHRGALSTFPAEIHALSNLQVADAEVAGGKLSLLYKLGPTSDLRVAVADTAGHVKASHVVNSFLAELAGWDPEHDQVWFWDRDAHNSLPDVHPDADNHLIAWNIGKDSERRYRIPIAQIRRAVDGAK